MKGWSHPNPEAAAPGEIVGIYPFTLSLEESELLGNQLFAADQDFLISHYMKEKYFCNCSSSPPYQRSASTCTTMILWRDCIQKPTGTISLRPMHS